MIDRKRTFEQIVSTAYDEGEFPIPKVEQVGDFDVYDIERPGYSSSYTVVRRGLGDAAIIESFSDSGNNTKLADKDGEIIHQEMPGGNNLVIETRDGVSSSRVITPEGTFEAPNDESPVPLNVEFPETEQHIKDWRDYS
jgi:hypothetical protein